MIYQTDPLLAGWIKSYGCTADALASYREFVMGQPWRVHEFGAAMHLAVDRGVISGDKNGDGDMDDGDEALIQDYQKLADHFGLPLTYLGKFAQADYDKFSGTDYWVLCAWHNARTNFTHWVVGNARPVAWDSIRGGSVTVAEGAPYSLQPDGSGGLRVFKKKVA